MRRAGRITAQARALAGSMVAPGSPPTRSTRRCAGSLRATARSPHFWATAVYPGSACISVNDEVIHGIPGPRSFRRATSSAWTWAPSSAGSTGTAPPPTPAALLSAEAGEADRCDPAELLGRGIKMARQGCRCPTSATRSRPM